MGLRPMGSANEAANEVRAGQSPNPENPRNSRGTGKTPTEVSQGGTTEARNKSMCLHKPEPGNNNP